MESNSSLQEPLVKHSPPSVTGSYGSFDPDPESGSDQETLLDQTVENDVIPETSVLGRNLGWSSAYILIISRVIGSGIFATPGSIYRSVGSIGITLVLWSVRQATSLRTYAKALHSGMLTLYSSSQGSRRSVRMGWTGGQSRVWLHASSQRR